MTDPDSLRAPDAPSRPRCLGPVSRLPACSIRPRSGRTATGLQLWLHRISVFLFVLISAVAGVLLIILPWTPEWTDNYLLLSFPRSVALFPMVSFAASAAAWACSISGSASGRRCTITSRDRSGLLSLAKRYSCEFRSPVSRQPAASLNLKLRSPKLETS